MSISTGRPWNIPVAAVSEAGQSATVRRCRSTMRKPVDLRSDERRLHRLRVPHGRRALRVARAAGGGDQRGHLPLGERLDLVVAGDGTSILSRGEMDRRPSPTSQRKRERRSV